jgi:hypothetical protein
MDEPLRNGIWNVLLIFVDDVQPKDLSSTRVLLYAAFDRCSAFAKCMWAEFLRRPLDSVPPMFEFPSRVREWFFDAEWYQIYDFLEWVNQCPYSSLEPDMFRKKCNAVFVQEKSAYRFVGDQIAPIIDEAQIQGIEGALAQTKDLGIDGANTHLHKALHLLSSRTEPDYKNSVKESISAVEGLCQIIVGDRSTTLGDALKAIEAKIPVHQALKKGFSSIYGWTSDEGGIRHADGFGEGECGQEDAIFMLVACSAFVSYLISKAQNAGINMQASL